MEQRKDPPLARVGRSITDFTERYFPDAFIFALAAVIFTFLLGLAIGEAPAKLVTAFGGGFWSLANFTIQMSIIIIGGFVVATAPPCAAVIEKLATIPKTPRGAVAFVSVFS